MNTYKICIAAHRKAPAIEELNLASDYAAIRRAERLASPGDTIQVFREAECIFMREELGTC